MSFLSHLPEAWPLIALALLAVGAVAGVLAGLLGVGGGIVIVPVLFLLSDRLGVPGEVAMHFAVATSLATIIPTSISSARSHRKKGSIDGDMLRAWGPFIFMGSALGGWLATGFSAQALSVIFGVVALLVSFNMMRKDSLILAQAPPGSFIGRFGIAAPIGAFSAMMGISGGALSVPAMTLLSFPVHRAVGTAAVFGLVIAIPGVAGFAGAGQDIDGVLPGSLGFVNLPAAVLISVATFLCAPVGVRLAHALSPRKLKVAFALFLAISALNMLSEAFLP